MDADSGHYVSIAKVGDASSAGLAVALLRSAGIPARMHGEGLGPYRMTVGEMAVTEIWVPEPDEDDAREILAGSDLETVPVEPTHTGALADPAALPMRVLAALVASVLVWSVVRWLMRVF
jgi:hypothetical protein